MVNSNQDLATPNVYMKFLSIRQAINDVGFSIYCN